MLQSELFYASQSLEYIAVKRGGNLVQQTAGYPKNPCYNWRADVRAFGSFPQFLETNGKFYLKLGQELHF